MNTVSDLLGPAPGRLAIATQHAIDRMKTGEPGDRITLAEMNALTNKACHVGGNGRGNVDTAIRHCEANHNVVWRWDRDSKAWECLSPAKRATHSSHSMHLLRKSTVRTLRIAAGTNMAELPPADRADLTVTIAVAGLMAAANGGTFRKLAVEMAARPSSKLEPPPTAKLIELMSG